MLRMARLYKSLWNSIKNLVSLLFLGRDLVVTYAPIDDHARDDEIVRFLISFSVFMTRSILLASYTSASLQFPSLLAGALLASPSISLIFKTHA
jgi:hypothetical protein